LIAGEEVGTPMESRPTVCPVAVARVATTSVKAMWLEIEIKLRIDFGDEQVIKTQISTIFQGLNYHEAPALTYISYRGWIGDK
jgi:hypothetical protein